MTPTTSTPKAWALLTLPICPLGFFLAGFDLTERGPVLALCYLFTLIFTIFVWNFPQDVR